MLSVVRSTSVLLLLVCLFTSCSKKDTQPELPPPPPSPPSPSVPVPTITSFAITDYCERKVTIIGTNFDTDISKDSIYFDNVKGVIDSVSSTRIIARYPEGNPSGKIIVYCNGRSVTSAQFFNGGSLIIPSFFPTGGGPGTPVTITGQNFNPDISLDSVFFNNVKAEIISATANQLVVSVPRFTSTGRITVYSNCQSKTSTASFEFSNKGTVYVSGNSGVLHAIDISTGNVIWKSETNSRFRSGPTYSDGVIYIGSSDVNNLSNNFMYALNALTGKQIWKYQAGPWDMIPAINNGVLYAGAFDKKLYAFNASTGQIKWSYTAGNYFSGDGPTYYDGKVYCRNDDSYFYCLDAETGTLIWKLPIWPGGNAAAANGVIYTAASGVLYALEANTGKTKWSRPISYLSGSSPTLADGILYIAAEDHQIYALDPSNGNVIWQLEASWWVASAVIVSNNILYIHSSDGVIGAVNAKTGAILWSKALPASFLSGACPVVVDGILFVGDDSGWLNALDALTGETIWAVRTGAYSIISSPCVVDADGNVHFAGDSGNQQ